MPTVLLISAAVIPSLLILWFVHARDVFPEPPRILWWTFALGVLSVIPAVALESALSHRAPTHGVVSGAAFNAFIVAALCEEGVKLAVLLFYSFRQSAFDEPMDGIVYGTAASLGFATLENLFYVADGGLAIAILRGFLSVPGHASYGIVMGSYVGRARVDASRRWRLIARGLVAAVLLHGFYDLPLMLTPGGAAAAAEPVAATGGAASFLWLSALAAIVLGWAWSLRLVSRVRREQLTLLARMASAVPPPVLEPTAPPVVNAPASTAAPPVLVHRAVTGPPPILVSGVPAPPPPLGNVMAWLGVLSGGTAACAGGLVVVSCSWMLALGDVAASERFYTALGAVLCGALPLAVGLFLFRFSVNRLNRERPALRQRHGPPVSGALLRSAS